MLGRRAPGSRRNPRPTAITHVRPVVRSNCTAITHAKFARARGTRITRSDSRPLCSYTTRPFALCAPLCLKQSRRRATAWCVTSHLAFLAVRPPCPTLVSRCGRARCPHRAAPSRCHAPRCRPHNYPRVLLARITRRVPWCGPVAHRHYAREIRTQCPRLLSAPRRKTQNRPWRLATFSAVGPPDPHMLTSSMQSMKKPLERRRSIGFRQNPGRRKAGAKPVSRWRLRRQKGVCSVE